MTNPKDIVPITDAGSDAFRRFKYQAEITFSYCLGCALGEDIVAVIPEHLEDISIEYIGNKWRFIQVKSRNPERGLWILSDLLVEGGGLHSLFRTYEQTVDVDSTLELLLEGATKSRNCIESLLVTTKREDSETTKHVAKALKISLPKADAFLKRVIISSPPAPRPHIRSANLNLIHQHKKAASLSQIEEIYSKVIEEIERAMQAEPAGLSWRRYITHPREAPSELNSKIAAKRLTKDLLRDLVSPINGPPRYLLRRSTERATSPISTLERKLLIGGAPVEIISQARNFHANSQIRLLEARSRGLFSEDAEIDDLRQRLETYAVTKKELHSESAYPAVNIWNDLLQLFSNNPGAIDRNLLLDADPCLLLGEVCDLAERCKIDWGISYAP